MASKPLLKALADAGVSSRRRLADAIREGRVRVNGEVIEDFRHPVDPAKDAVSVDGRTCRIDAEPMVYLLLHKPEGVLSTTRDERGRPTVTDLLPARYSNLRLHLVGRLDKDSTGLLLLTNDGELTHRLTHPRFEHEKEYHVTINTTLGKADRRRLEKGIELDDGITWPARVTVVNEQSFSYAVTIHEGRKRQVRRMFEHLGYRVKALKRVRMGSLRMGSLTEGGVRELTPRELRQLRREGFGPVSGR
jgi:23S rRNA pseudouridine2605 synthase